MSKLEKMVELAKRLSVGMPFRFKDLDAKVIAFNDEHLFLTVPEIAVPPEHVETAGEQFLTRDRNLDDYRRRVAELEREIERLLHDRQYYEYMQSRIAARRRSYEGPRVFAGYDLGREVPIDPAVIRELNRMMPSPRIEPPTKPYIYDDFQFRKPSQQK